MPRTSAEVRFPNQLGKLLIVLPWVMYSASPVQADIVASVATKGCTRP